MSRSGRVVATLLVATAGCVGGVRPTPAPVTVPELELPRAELPPILPREVELVEPGPESAFGFDPILRSPVTRDPTFRARVEHWIEVFRTREAEWFPEYLGRMAALQPVVDASLAERGLPPSLRYLPIVESGYSPGAVSHATAVGVWQFMAPTARALGLEVGPLLDERRNPIKSTHAAAAFLQELRARFGSWFLALAAYNAGPYRVQRVLRRHAPEAEPSDSLYWALRRYLPRETRDFVPRFLAAVEVARRPSRFGFVADPGIQDFSYDTVVVPDATTLDVVAQAAGVDQAAIERLNPEIVRGITPPGRRVTLRVPEGAADRFEVSYATIPPGDRVTFVEHRVVRGETLTHIARRYHVPLRDLRAANPGVRPRRLQIGQILTVPVAPRAPGR